MPRDDADPHRPLLLFGASGWLGAAVCDVLAGRPLVAPRSSELDVAEANAVAELVARVRPSAVLNLAAVNPGQGDAARMEAINHRGAEHVARAADAVGARLVYVSSDMVLDGEHAPYDESAPPAPVNAYGRSKALGERASLEHAADSVAVRTSLVWDPAEMDRSTAGFARHLAEDPELVLFEDEIRMPITRRCLAAALVELVDADVRGVLNVAGPQPLSRYGIGTRLLRWFGVPGLDRIRPGTAAALGLTRPRDLTLDLGRARAVLRTPLRGVDEELARAGAGSDR